jgi:tetratricopeptide (TPR) repeat protein
VTGTEPRARLIGRGAVLTALDRAVADAAEGTGGLLVVTGDAGLGKTSVARDAVRRATRAGFAVGWGACWEDDPRPAAPWAEALAGVGGVAATVAEELAGAADGDGEDDLASVEHAGRHRVEVLADLIRSAGPTLVVLDDLHWADPETLRLLRAVRGPLATSTVLVVGTARAFGRPELAAAVRAPDRMPLRPLDTEEVAALVEDLGGPADLTTVEQVHALAGGNPFLVREVVHLLGGDGADRLPAIGADVLGRRVAERSPRAQAVIRAASVVGLEVDAGLLATMTGRPPTQVTAALDEAGAAGLGGWTDTPGRWAFVHDLLRQAVRASLPTDERAELHLAAGRALAADPESRPPDVALHLLAAGPVADPAETAAATTAAGRWSAERQAWDQAVASYRESLRVIGATDDVARAEVLLLLGAAELRRGDVDAAADAFTSAAGIAERHGSGELLARAALGFGEGLSGFEVRLFDQRQVDLLERAITLLDAHPDGPDAPRLRAWVLARLSVALSLVAPGERRLALAEEAVAAARAAADDLALAHALAARCDALAGPDFVDERVEAATEIVGLARRHDDIALELLGRRLRVVALFERCEWTAAVEEVEAYARRAAPTGNPFYEWLVPMWRASWAMISGPPERARAEHATFEALAARAASPNAALLLDVQRLSLAFYGSDLDEYRAAADRLIELIPEELSPSSTGAFVHGLVAQGRMAEVRQALDRMAAGGFERIARDAEWLPCLYMLLEDAIVARHGAALRIFVDAAEPYAHLCAVEGIVAGFEGPLGLALAEARLALGDHDRAVADARAALDRTPIGPLHARAQRTLARALRRRGEPDDAAEAEQLLADAGDVPLTILELTRPDESTAADPKPHTPTTASAAFVREGDVWRIAFAGQEVVVRHAKGLADLAALLARPNVDVHVTELEPLPAGVDSGGPAGDPVLDRRAVAEYRARLTELDADLADAEGAHDLDRAASVKAERDYLLDELRAASGLGGRRRTLGPDPVERVRKAVTGRIRASISKLEEVHPALGRHLANAVRTGVVCSYRPEQDVSWRI